MRRILLVTAREYRRMVTLPGFWIISLIVPVFIIIAPVAQRFLGKSNTAGYVLVDKSGRYQAQIDRRLELDYQRQVLLQLFMYAEEWRASSTNPKVQRVPQIGSSSSDAVIEAFIAAGGAPALLRQLKPKLLATAPPFQPPPRQLVKLPLPTGVNTDDAGQFGATIGPHFREASKTAAGRTALAVAVYIPGDVDYGGQVRVWTNGPAGNTLVQDVRIELTQSMRLKALHAAGVDPLSAAQIESLSVIVSIAPPEMPRAGSEAAVHSILPLALAYLLLASMMITGSMMLQGLVEERSNKLLEAVLACVSPRELMAGKLVGISAIGLSIVGIWVGGAVTITKAQPSSPLSFLLPALASLWQTPGIAAEMFFYFLAGYLTIGMIFLAVGLMRDSMQETQAYLMPLALIIAVPSAGLFSVIYRDPNGVLPRIFSWIPLYTPVTMLARLQSGVSSFDLFGTAAVLLAFGGLELFVLGRLFENNLIQTGREFHFAGNMRRAILAGLVVLVMAVAFAVRHGRAPAQTHEVGPPHSRGEAVFKANCAKCHDPAVGRAPSREQLASLDPADVVNSLTSGSMKTMAAGLSGTDIRAIATFLTGRQTAAVIIVADPPACPSSPNFSMAGGGWRSAIADQAEPDAIVSSQNPAGAARVPAAVVTKSLRFTPVKIAPAAWSRQSSNP